MVNGKELANAYSELNDPIDQRERFEDQLKLVGKRRRRSDVYRPGFFACTGIWNASNIRNGNGNRPLTMFMTNSPSIQDVLFFPQMKPEKKPIELTEEEKMVMNLLKEKSPVALSRNQGKIGAEQ
jgi:lysyl-tRNA synthetase, class II